MAFDAPATIAILGAGPIGLEAALYARYLGYTVLLFERGRVAERVRRAARGIAPRPFGEWSSPLGRGALEAQSPDAPLPALDQQVTADEWLTCYLEPLARSDLLSDELRLGTTVRAASRERLLKRELPGSDDRDEFSFRVLVDDGRREWTEVADIVIDATGTDRPLGLGPGGAAAVGERGLRALEAILDFAPDISGAERERFAGRSTLVVGAGRDACSTIEGLLRLVAEAPSTSMMWSLRHESLESCGDDSLARLAGRFVEAGGQLRLGAWIESLERCDGGERLRVAWLGAADSMEVDHVVADLGWRPDTSLTRELQVPWCGWSERPASLSAWCAAHPEASPTRASGDALRQPEIDCYILGAKSHGRLEGFGYLDGLHQIRELFAIIGDRASLDLYRT